MLIKLYVRVSFLSLSFYIYIDQQEKFTFSCWFCPEIFIEDPLVLLSISPHIHFDKHCEYQECRFDKFLQRKRTNSWLNQ